jgi:predicted enzyme related to lactoylglutathione lyase
MIRIALSSVFVDDQEKALMFYTDVLGFVKKRDIPVGDARWLTVAPTDASGGLELMLEPNSNPIAKPYQQAVYEAGWPATSFVVDDLHYEYERLKERGVAFRMAPTEVDGAAVAVFDHTCGNLIQLYQAERPD